MSRTTKKWLFRLGIDRLDLNWSQSPRYIYYHIPKNAGTSIAKGLQLERSFHSSVKRAEYYLGKQRTQYFQFSIVRNPFDRFLSLFRYAQMEESAYHSNKSNSGVYGQHLDFDLLKSVSLNECAQYLKEGRLKHDDHWNHWNTQSSYLLNQKKELDLDYIGRFENLPEAINRINARLSMSIELHSENQSREIRDYKSAYDPETKKIIEQYYQEDLERFKYVF